MFAVNGRLSMVQKGTETKEKASLKGEGKGYIEKKDG